MNFFKKLLGKKNHTNELSNPITQHLISNDEKTFLKGLNDACDLADSNKYQGIESMREAIRIRNGKKNVVFYKPGMVSTVGGERYTDARRKIIALASKKKILDDVFASGGLISAFFFTSDMEALTSLTREIYSVGGASEGFAFQLLFNELMYSARFAKSQ